MNMTKHLALVVLLSVTSGQLLAMETKPKTDLNPTVIVTDTNEKKRDMDGSDKGAAPKQPSPQTQTPPQPKPDTIPIRIVKSTDTKIIDDAIFLSMSARYCPDATKYDYSSLQGSDYNAARIRLLPRFFTFLGLTTREAQLKALGIEVPATPVPVAPATVLVAPMALEQAQNVVTSSLVNATATIALLAQNPPFQKPMLQELAKSTNNPESNRFEIATLMASSIDTQTADGNWTRRQSPNKKNAINGFSKIITTAQGIQNDSEAAASNNANTYLNKLRNSLVTPTTNVSTLSLENSLKDTQKDFVEQKSPTTTTTK